MLAHRSLREDLDRALADGLVSKGEARATQVAFDAELRVRFGDCAVLPEEETGAETQPDRHAEPPEIAVVEAAALEAVTSAFDAPTDGSAARAHVLAERARETLRRMLDDSELPKAARKEITRRAEARICDLVDQITP
ncbi:hypothetical protein [Psychromarinibacter sediminicola]|nr:hypothetical protein [Psychromarinibacter sediminicola]